MKVAISSQVDFAPASLGANNQQIGAHRQRDPGWPAAQAAWHRHRRPGRHAGRGTAVNGQ
jgi:hypothetical protein